ncbi:MAG: cob(I)yrinic acid a,c-diamide adenosyltransferase [Nanoarchaeota archaeon]|nr:cob(I)yrinic acid a,c-diamide adenosyltransferase [Nanoarchaeota archaeon]
MKRGLVHIYTGKGKGKTTASIGLALRAVGQGFKVFIIQFMKGGAYTGEYISAKNFLPNIEIMQFGKPCIKEIKQTKLKGFEEGYEYFDYVRDDIYCSDCRYCFLNDEKQKEFVESAWKKSLETVHSGDYGMVILDEINNALSHKLLEVDRVLSLIKNKPPHVELILTGRDAPKEICKIADLITEMKLIRHYYDKGISARRGIEY